MKKLFMLWLTLLVFHYVAITQATTTGGDEGKKAAKSRDSAPKSLTGTISQDGRSLTNPADQKSWIISNSERVKGYEGKTVTVKALVNAEKNEIQVMDVKPFGPGIGTPPPPPPPPKKKQDNSTPPS